MKLLSLMVLLGAASATSEQGIMMLKQLNAMDQNIENLSNVRDALVQCAAAGDCSQEAAAMPKLALSTTETASDTHSWPYYLGFGMVVGCCAALKRSGDKKEKDDDKV